MQKTLEQIDYFTIRDQVASFCLSEEGKVNLEKRLPLHNSDEIEHLKKASREWLNCICASSTSPFNGWSSIRPLLSVIRMTGASLTLEQVYTLGQFCTACSRAFTYIDSHYVDWELPVLKAESEKLLPVNDASNKIYRIITPDGEMKDLPEIAAIRKQIASLNSRIKNIMNSFLKDSKYTSVLESNVPVLKSGRQVLAVKAGMQNKIEGIVHEVSATAKTVYIEPTESVHCTNELIQKEFELESEIKRILTQLTESLQENIPVFKTNLPLMEFFDTTLAAARWGKENNCVYAIPCLTNDHSGQNRDEPPLLYKARHPLLGEKAVPIDVQFMSGKRVLIITGPNTGGKTVTLKTFALFAMLNQTGLPVPAGEGSRLPVFGKIFADIGDDQSLDQSLSTFSGHMKNISKAIKFAEDDSLVLLDELGSGTDPLEGTAISMAVLDHLIEKKAFVLVTTHQGILKNYGYTNPACINASVEFDTTTLSPSYRLLMGVPGESHALEIAGKSGLPRFIVNNAKNYIATEKADVSSLIKGLNTKHRELDRMKSQMDKLQRQLDEKEQRQTERDIELREKEHQLKQGFQKESEEFLAQSRKKLENLVRELREGEITREKTLGVKQFINDLTAATLENERKIQEEEERLGLEKLEAEKKAHELRSHTSNKKTKKRLSNREALAFAESTPVSEAAAMGKASDGKTMPLLFEEGVQVEVGANHMAGTLVKLEKKGVWKVQFGSVQMSCKEKDMVLVGGKMQAGDFKADISVEMKGDSENEAPVFELRLLGMRMEDAIRALERQLDLCTLHNFPHFSIIHGKGNGILQQAVHDYLSHYQGVADFRFAPPEDGGFGKTYVTMKQ